MLAAIYVLIREGPEFLVIVWDPNRWASFVLIVNLDLILREFGTLHSSIHATVSDASLRVLEAHLGRAFEILMSKRHLIFEVRSEEAVRLDLMRTCPVPVLLGMIRVLRLLHGRFERHLGDELSNAPWRLDAIFLLLHLIFCWLIFQMAVEKFIIVFFLDN